MTKTSYRWSCTSQTIIKKVPLLVQSPKQVIIIIFIPIFCRALFSRQCLWILSFLCLCFFVFVLCCLRRFQRRVPILIPQGQHCVALNKVLVLFGGVPAVQYTQLESIRLWYLRFDKPEIDSWTLFHRIDTNRFPFCWFEMPEVDLRETYKI